MTARLYSADDGQTPNFTMKIINIQHHRNTELRFEHKTIFIKCNLFLQFHFRGLHLFQSAFYKERLITKPAVLCLRVILALCFN